MNDKVMQKAMKKAVKVIEKAGYKITHKKIMISDSIVELIIEAEQTKKTFPSLSKV